MMRPMQMDLQDKQILDFYCEAGVDEVIGDTPVNHFDLPSAPATTPSIQEQKPTPVRTTRPTPSSMRHSPAIPGGELAETAKKIAAGCSSIDELKQALNSFDGFFLKKMATNTVFGEGDPASPILLIDRAPSAEEDRTGLPFAGEGGLLLRKMLAAIDLDVETTYRISALPWRPPGGKTPTKEEQAICLPFLKRHIELANPQVGILFGEAASFLSDQKAGINRLRGKWMDVSCNSKSVRAFPIFHPAFLMEHPASKKTAWQDLLTLKPDLPGIA